MLILSSSESSETDFYVKRGNQSGRIKIFSERNRRKAKKNLGRKKGQQS